MCRFDKSFIAEIAKVVFHRSAFAVVECLAQVRRADDAKAASLAQELFFLWAHLKTGDIASRPRRTPGIVGGNRTAALPRDAARCLRLPAFRLGTCPAVVGSAFLQRLQTMEDGVIGQLAGDLRAVR